MTEEQLASLSKLAFKNANMLETVEEVCCYYCLSRFPKIEIKEVVVEDDKQETAICPKCGIDSILPSNSVTQEQLIELNKHYFY